MEKRFILRGFSWIAFTGGKDTIHEITYDPRNHTKRHEKEKQLGSERLNSVLQESADVTH